MKLDAVMASGSPYAHVGGQLAYGLAEVTDDLRALDSSGFWVVVGTFEGRWTCARFRHVVESGSPHGAWPGLDRRAWTSSLDAEGYVERVERIRRLISAGTVYQVNLCRVLSAPLDAEASLDGLSGVLAAGNPAPFAARVHLPEVDVDLVSASPELYLRREGVRLASAPIKGTGRVPDDLTGKDVAENVMIVDLVRNDLGRVSRTGSVAVQDALAVESHPGLVQLVSTVTGDLADGKGWADVLDATFPPGSVSGAPKSTALTTIAELETAPRGPYCGAIGWVDADTAHGELAVGIRTFWRADGMLRFGTGAGITWGSNPQREWRETELKAAHLLGLAASDRRSR